MEAPGKPEREYGVTEILERSFNLYSQHFVNLYLPFLAAAIVSGLLGALIAAMIWVPSIWDPFGAYEGYLGALIGAGILSGIISWVVSTLAMGAAIRYASEVIGKGRADLSESVSYTASRLLTLLGAAIITGILVAIGLILLIIPGVILFLMFAVVVPTIVIEKQGIFESLGRSRKLMGRRWLKAFALFILIGIIRRWCHLDLLRPPLIPGVEHHQRPRPTHLRSRPRLPLLLYARQGGRGKTTRRTPRRPDLASVHHRRLDVQDQLMNKKQGNPASQRHLHVCQSTEAGKLSPVMNTPLTSKRSMGST